ncbi:MAG: hypothetical protein P4L36_03470 [Holophaga sp.]|nr:hypothetical protein [Holophaga sp.]
MGFFDFLARQGQPAAAGIQAFEPLPEGTSTSTRFVRELLEVPKAARNPAWSDQFLEHVADAAFFSRHPSVVLGAERLPYFALHSTPADPQDFPSHVIHHMKDDALLEHGMGVVINPNGQEADWAFSFGDILHFHLYGSFYPAKGGASKASPGRAPQALPVAARKALRAFLQGLGVKEPRVMLAARDHAGPGSMELVFGFSPQEFTSLDEFRFAMNNLSWFLPRNYSYSVAGNQARKDGAFEQL